MKSDFEPSAEVKARVTVGPPTSVLEKAAAIVKDRRAVYGEPDEYFIRFAGLLSAYLEHPVSPAQAAMIMLLGKVARLIASPSHEDSIVDIAGYLDCYAQVVKR